MVLYLACLALTGVSGIPAGAVYLLVVLVLGNTLTVMVALEWSSYMPGRKLALWLVLAGSAWWLASATLVRYGYLWQIWHPINSAVLLFLAFSIGFWLAGEIEKSGHLIPVCILGILVDIWSVFQGPGRQVGRMAVEHVQKAQEAVQQGLQPPPPPLVSFLIVHWPLPGGSMMAPIFGMGDWVFLALLMASSRKFGLSIVKNTLLVIGGIFIALIAVNLLGKPLPALPFICGLFLVGNFRKLSLTRKEWQLTGIIAGAVLLVSFLNWITGMMGGRSGG
jgi:hypothetical protein